jgi:hypothetical protein
MSNRRYGTVKELPYIWYEIDAVESWLDEQAQQGLRLTDIQGKLCVFQPSDEPPARCRVHVKPHNGYYTQQEEYKETMRELGWEYVGRINYRADVYRATRPDAVEINTDEDVLRSLLCSNMWFDGIAAAALIALTVYSLWKKFAITRAYSGFYSLLLDDIIVTYLIPEVLLALILVLLAGAFLVRLARQRKRCLLGRDCRFDGVLRKRKRFYFVLLGLLILMFAFPMLPTIFGVPEATESTSFDTCPVVLLQSLSPEEAEQIVVEDYDIPVRSNHYLLADDTIYRQSGPTVWLEGTGWGYTPLYYTVTVTDVHREELAEKYYMEIFAAHDDWQEVQISGWDQAVYRRHTNTLREEWHNDSDKIPADITLHHQNLMMRLGNRVVVVSYTGEADMYSRLNTLYGRRTPSPAAE